MQLLSAFLLLIRLQKYEKELKRARFIQKDLENIENKKKASRKNMKNIAFTVTC